MKKSLLATTMALLLSGSFACVALAGCNSGDNTPVEFSYEAETLSQMTDPVNDYNSNLFYVNNLEFEIADPTVIQITEGDEKGYFYVYGTSDEIGAHGFQAWRSKDLSHWECMGIALEPDHDVTWASENYWAPEVIYDEEDELYYLFYNAYNRFDNNRLWLSVACSEHPAGPFVSPNGKPNADGKMLYESEPVFDVSANNPVLAGLASTGQHTLRTNALDASPFIDPVTGDKYMYFGYRNDGGAPDYDGTHIYGVKMKDWFTPDYSTIKQLTYQGYTTVAGGLNKDNNQTIDDGNINEGPFMIYHEGSYYLTYSRFGTHETSYRVMQAIGDGPLGTFTKVDEDDGGTVISTSSTWNHIVTAGHHCFIKCGNETFIAYHTYKNRVSYGGGRALAVDKVVWTKNSQGQSVLHTNGPTWSVQALPESVSGYKNIAPSATITANNTAGFSNANFLNDEIVKYQEFDCATEYTANAGTSTIKLSWNNFKTVRAIMIYNSYDYLETFVDVGRIEFEYKKSNGKTGKAVIKELGFDWDWHCDYDYEFMRPGGAAIAEFAEMPVKSITITLQAPEGAEYLSLGEIVVLGKDAPCDGISEFTEYSYQNSTCGSSHLINESANFGTPANTNLQTMYGYDLSNDNGTADAYITQKSVGQQAAYFNNVYADTFYVEAEFTVTTTKPYLGDGYPKFGLLVTGDGTSNKIFYYVDAQGFNTSRVGFAERKLDDSDWDWAKTERLANVNGVKYTDEQYVKLAILRIGKNFYFICNDQMVLSYDSFYLFNDTQKAAVGFMSFNTGLKIKNYKATTDASVIAEMTGKYVPTNN